ncbi:MAG: PHP domain-containing protein [Oscillospiraceae bacterium]
MQKHAMKLIDLHAHSTASDGTASPRALAELALRHGLSALALTDHDTVLGYPELKKAGEELGIETVPGIEISTNLRRAVHILGYYIDPHSPHLEQVLNWVVEDRDKRNKEMCRLMAADGLPVNYEDMKKRFGPVIGRPHFADLLVELGLAKNVRDAFDRYVEKGQRYYVGRTILPIEKAIEIIRLAKGVPVLAHPFQYQLDDPGLRELIEYCMTPGTAGHGVPLQRLCPGAERLSGSPGGGIRSYQDRRQRLPRQQQAPYLPGQRHRKQAPCPL